MGFVAILAGRRCHTFDVRFVAIKTRGAVTVFGVAGCAFEGGVDRGVFLKFFQLAVMAGSAGGGNGLG